MKRRLLLLLLPMLCATVLSFLPTILSWTAASVSVISPSMVSYQKTLSYSGEVHPAKTREIYLETAVIPEEVLVRPGDTVQKGSVLARIDTGLTQTVLKNGVVIPGETTDAQRQQYVQAYGLTEEEVVAALGGQPQTSVSQGGEAAFIPSEILAPMDGVVTQIQLSEGVFCSPNQAAVVISSVQNNTVLVQVRQSDIDQIAVGTCAQISGEGLQGKSYQAVVEMIYPAAQEQSSGLTSQTVVPVALSVENSDQDLKSGYQVDVTFLPEEEKQYLALPYEAICQDENNLEYVWVVQQGRAVRKNVETGIELPDCVEITSGISAADQVILSPESIRQNQLVLVRREESYA